MQNNKCNDVTRPSGRGSNCLQTEHLGSFLASYESGRANRLSRRSSSILQACERVTLLRGVFTLTSLPFVLMNSEATFFFFFSFKTFLPFFFTSIYLFCYSSKQQNNLGIVCQSTKKKASYYYSYWILLQHSYFLHHINHILLLFK